MLACRVPQATRHASNSVTGELARKQTEYRNKVVSGIEAPKAVPGVRATEQPRTYHIDPTVTVDRDIRNADGAMLYARARAAREGKNPKTGEKLKIKATTVPKFTAGANFKEKVANKGKAKKK